MIHFTTNRRMLIKFGAAAGLASAMPLSLASDLPALKAPAKGKIPVAILLSQGAVVIDFAGPWEVFQDVRDFSRGDAVEEVAPFQLFTVAATMAPIQCSGGMTVVPNYTFETTPDPKIVIIPAQQGAGETELAWLKKTSAKADMTMSICTGAIVLARTGLLDGKTATTHHSAFDPFSKLFPKITLERDARFVDHGNLATSAGLSAGIDLALHVVERYFGHGTALQTARQMEYQGQGWTNSKLDAHEHSENQATTEPGKQPATGYACPPCGCAADGRVFPEPGRCPACGMTLIKKG
jgi:transcriptional regulator GlxA family with amidase domain